MTFRANPFPFGHPSFIPQPNAQAAPPLRFNPQLNFTLPLLNPQPLVNPFNFLNLHSPTPFVFGNANAIAPASAPRLPRLQNAAAAPSTSSSQAETDQLFREAHEALEELKRRDPQGLAFLNDELEAAEIDNSESPPCFLIRHIGDSTSFRCLNAEKYADSPNWAYLKYPKNIAYSGQISLTGRPHGIGMLMKINGRDKVSIDECEVVCMRQGTPGARLILELINGEHRLREIKKYDSPILNGFYLGPATPEQLAQPEENNIALVTAVAANAPTPNQYTPVPTPTPSQQGRIQRWAATVDTATNPPRQPLQPLNIPPSARRNSASDEDNNESNGRYRARRARLNPQTP